MISLKFVLWPMLLFIIGFSEANVGNLICYYDASSYERIGPAQLMLTELEPALQFCNYLIYGSAGIDKQTYQIKSLNENLEIKNDHYRTVTALKRKHPNLRILLSVGLDKQILDDGETNQYLTLLEDSNSRQNFISSAKNFLRNYNFDGLDLAWQFPKTFPKQVRSGVGRAWSSFKSFFTGGKKVDEKAEEHKEQFTSLVRELRNAFRTDGNYLLTLTILPNVDASLFIDIPAVVPNLNFINLATFDFQTPERNPKVADHAAPLYELYEREPQNNINYQVNYWLNNSAPANKLNIGVATYARSWIMSKDSGLTGHPPVPDTRGAAPIGRQTQSAGLLSWPEVCEKLNAPKEATGADARLRKVGDPTKRFGNYAYRSADDNDENGIWVSYEDPTTAGIKADYANARRLGGVALFDVSLDDFRGQCAGEKFPILRSIKYKL